MMSVIGGSAILPAAARLPSPNAAGAPGIVRSGRSIESFGARPDASGTKNLAALRRCISACRDDGAPVLVPAGEFALANGGDPIVLDLTRIVRGAPHAIALTGLAGPGQSVLRIEGRSGGLRFEGPTDWFDPVIEGLGFIGGLAGPLVSIGRDDFSDPVNMLRLFDVSIENSFDQGPVAALRLNYIAPGSVAVGLKANGYADGRGRNYGTAIECRQVECMVFAGGAASNAAVGMAIRDGVNFGINVQGFTFENSNVAFSNEVSTSGAHVVIGCQFSAIIDHAIRSSGCNQSQWIEFVADNFAMDGGTILDPSACEGVWIHDRHGIPTPTLPASGQAIRNLSGRSVQITMWGGMVHAIMMDGTRMEIGTPTQLAPGTALTVPPGSTIGIDYVQPPAWQWRCVG